MSGGQTNGEYPLVPASYGCGSLPFLILGCPTNCAMKTMTISLHGHQIRTKRNRANVKEARRRQRIKFSLPVHVRPFNSRLLNIEDVGEVLNFTQDGLYFVTCMPYYQTGMRLIVTFPFGKATGAQRRFLGTVVRLEERPYGNSGVAAKLRPTFALTCTWLSPGTTYSTGSSTVMTFTVGRRTTFNEE